MCPVPYFFFSSRRRHTRLQGDWSSDVCSSDLERSSCRTTQRDTDSVTTPAEVGCCPAVTRGPLHAKPCRNGPRTLRSEERRVGKEAKSGRRRYAATGRW